MRTVDGDAQPAARPTGEPAVLSARTGWTMVVAVFVILMTLNGLTFYSMSAYIDALVDERGMSLTLASGSGLESRSSGGRSSSWTGIAALIPVIAEVKRASPSKGILRENFSPAEIARSYAAGGAA